MAHDQVVGAVCLSYCRAMSLPGRPSMPVNRAPIITWLVVAQLNWKDFTSAGRLCGHHALDVDLETRSHIRREYGPCAGERKVTRLSQAHATDPAIRCWYVPAPILDDAAATLVRRKTHPSGAATPGSQLRYPVPMGSSMTSNLPRRRYRTDNLADATPSDHLSRMARRRERCGDGQP